MSEKEKLQKDSISQISGGCCNEPNCPRASKHLCRRLKKTGRKPFETPPAPI